MKIVKAVGMILLLSGASLHAAWTSDKTIKTVNYNYDANMGSMYIQTQGVDALGNSRWYIYYANQAGCTEDRAKFIYSILISAKSTGDVVRLDTTTATGDPFFKGISTGQQ